MQIWEILLTITVAMSIPSAVFAATLGVLVRRMEKKWAKKDADREQKEEARKKFEVFQVKMTTAIASVCEANSIALQKGKCNGETHSALKYLKEVQHDQRDFLASQGINNIF